MLKTARAGRSPSPKVANSKANLLGAGDRAAHDWYRFVLSFPPHLVRDYIERLGVAKGQRVLDPFCGTGTTLVECKKLGIESVGVEPNPMACAMLYTILQQIIRDIRLGDMLWHNQEPA
jgi:hypothetical protein